MKKYNFGEKREEKFEFETIFKFEIASDLSK